MADTKVTGLTENTAPILTDILYIVDDPGGSAASQKVTLANIQALLNLDGWTAAGETWTYASADDPTFTFTITGDKTGKYSAGMRLKLTQTTIKYFIVTKVEYGAPNTTMTIYGGTDYDLANAAITLPYYSVVKAPHGFPLSPNKWMASATDTSQRIQATPAQNTWYNLGSLTLSIPIGSWEVSYHVTAHASDSNSQNWTYEVTLSTANNSESDADFTSSQIGGNTINVSSPHFKNKWLDLAAKTSYYLNTRTTQTNLDNLVNRNDENTAFIRAVCAYL